MIFHQEIIERLKELEAPENRVIVAYGCQHGAWAAPNWKWTGETVQVRAYIATITGKQYLSLEMQWERARRLTGFHHLGIIGEKYRSYVPPGTTKTMKIHTTRVLRGQSSTVTLFDENMSDEEINEWIYFK